MWRKWLILLVIVITGGCATETPVAVSNPYRHYQSDSSLAASRLSPPLAGEMLRILYSQHRTWQGTPYHLGGLSRKGVDCSGFVYLTFLNRLDIRLPRSTEGQSRVGLRVPVTELEPGDLVFFHTGRYRHVGIYLQDSKFLHVSTHAGVRISSLNSEYWSRTYWQARRIEGLSQPLAANLK